MVDSEISTDRHTRVAKASCSEDYMKRYVTDQIQKNNKSEASLWMKIGLAVIPFAIAFFVWTSDLNTRVTVIEEKQNSITEIKNDIRKLSEEVIKIRIELSKGKPNE